MIDLHSHIIPGVDDGATDMEQALAMLKIAEEDGIQGIAATPHLFINRSRIKEPAEIQAGFTQLKTAVKKADISIDLFYGAEVFFVSDLRDKLHDYNHLLCLNNSDYFLLEFPLDMVFPGSQDFIFGVLSDGLIPIICHPERNEVFQNNPYLLYQFLELGALAQINAGSLRGEFGANASAAAFRLLKYNLVHIIASDAHNTLSRRPELSFVYRDIGLDRNIAELLVHKIPEAVLQNRGIPDIGPFKDPRKNTTLFTFFRSLFR